MTTPCGCGNDAALGECFCSVASSGTISASGSGTPNSPYQFSLVPGAALTSVTGTDTDTVDLTVAGNGGAVDISADVILSGDTGNVIVHGTDGGLYVPNGTAGNPIVEGHVFQNTSQPLPSGVPVAINFDAANPGTPGTVQTIPIKGAYVFSVFLEIAETTIAIPSLKMWIGAPDDAANRYSGNGRSWYQPADDDDPPAVHFTDILGFPAGQQLTLWCQQNSGQTLHTTSPLGATRLTFYRMGDSL